jgi:hypothetical protein
MSRMVPIFKIYFMGVKEEVEEDQKEFHLTFCFVLEEYLKKK